MPDEVAAPQAPQPEAPAQPSAPEPQPFSGQAAVEEVFSRINRSPLPPRQSPRTAQETQSGQEAATPTAEPPAPPEDKTDWKKRYSDLQSDYDRRAATQAAKVEEKLRQEFGTQMQQLTQAILLKQQQQAQQSSTPQADDYDRPLTRAEAKQLAQQEAYAIAQQIIASDPRLQVAGHISDYARFKDEKPESAKYDPFVKILLKYFPAAQGADLYNHLSQATGFFEELEREALAVKANGRGEGVRGAAPPVPQGVHPNVNQAAAELAERAARYRQEQGITPPNPTRPAIDTDGDLESGIDQIVGSILRPRR